MITYEPVWYLSDGFGTGWIERASMGSRPLVPALSGVTEKPATSMRPQEAPTSGQKLSWTAPEPTMAKSSLQDCSSTGWYSVTAASRKFRTICLPLMPPASLHHCTKASLASKISWFRPGRPSKPGSDTVPTTISSALMPWVSAGSVVVTSPPPSFGPQTPSRSPKSPAAAVPTVVSDGVLSAPPDSSSPRSLPQLAATSAAMPISASSARRRPFMVPPLARRPPGRRGTTIARI
jgi:hypothetical protein